jgi:hypothetical protein
MFRERNIDRKDDSWSKTSDISRGDYRRDKNEGMCMWMSKYGESDAKWAINADYSVGKGERDFVIS